MCAELAPNLAEVNPSCAESAKHLVDSGSKLADIHWSKSARNRPEFVRSSRPRPNSGRIWAKFGRTRPLLAQLCSQRWPDFARRRPLLRSQTQPNLKQLRPRLVRSGRSSLFYVARSGTLPARRSAPIADVLRVRAGGGASIALMRRPAARVLPPSLLLASDISWGGAAHGALSSALAVTSASASLCCGGPGRRRRCQQSKHLQSGTGEQSLHSRIPTRYLTRARPGPRHRTAHEAGCLPLPGSDPDRTGGSPGRGGGLAFPSSLSRGVVLTSGRHSRNLVARAPVHLCASVCVHNERQKSLARRRRRRSTERMRRAESGPTVCRHAASTGRFRAI